VIEGGGFDLGVISEQALYTALWPARGFGEALVGICGICVLSKSNSGVRYVHLDTDFETDDLKKGFFLQN
jgi:hypothetical protein